MTVFQEGIDVSRYQGVVDWSAVAAAGKEFAIVRVGSSNQSGPYVDPCFTRNVQGAHADGLRVGAYFYTYAKTESEVIRELDGASAVAGAAQVHRRPSVFQHFGLYAGTHCGAVVAVAGLVGQTVGVLKQQVVVQSFGADKGPCQGSGDHGRDHRCTQHTSQEFFKLHGNVSSYCNFLQKQQPFFWQPGFPCFAALF